MCPRGQGRSRGLHLWKGALLWQITSCSLIGLLIIALRNFQRFSDRSFVSAFEPIFIFKLD